MFFSRRVAGAGCWWWVWITYVNSQLKIRKIQSQSRSGLCNLNLASPDTVSIHLDSLCVRQRALGALYCTGHGTRAPYCTASAAQRPRLAVKKPFNVQAFKPVNTAKYVPRSMPYYPWQARAAGCYLHDANFVWRPRAGGSDGGEGCVRSVSRTMVLFMMAIPPCYRCAAA